eukprot:5215232-Amphidinium_carterae.1
MSGTGHGVLRTVARHIRLLYRGLDQIACNKGLGLSACVERKLMAVDEAFNSGLHITEMSVETHTGGCRAYRG